MQEQSDLADRRTQAVASAAASSPEGAELLLSAFSASLAHYRKANGVHCSRRCARLRVNARDSSSRTWHRYGHLPQGIDQLRTPGVIRG